MSNQPNNKTLDLVLVASCCVIFGWLAINSYTNGDISMTWRLAAFSASLFSLSIIDTYIQKNQTKTIDTLKKLGLLPKPSEAGMFVMALTAFILMVSSQKIWDETLWLMSEDVRYGLIIIYIAVGGGLSIYHAFSQRKKRDFEKRIMKYFYTITLAAITVSTAVFIYKTKQPFFWFSQFGTRFRRVFS